MARKKTLDKDSTEKASQAVGNGSKKKSRNRFTGRNRKGIKPVFGIVHTNKNTDCYKDIIPLTMFRTKDARKVANELNITLQDYINDVEGKKKMPIIDRYKLLHAHSVTVMNLIESDKKAHQYEKFTKPMNSAVARKRELDASIVEAEKANDINFTQEEKEALYSEHLKKLYPSSYVADLHQLAGHYKVKGGTWGLIATIEKRIKQGETFDEIGEAYDVIDVKHWEILFKATDRKMAGNTQYANIFRSLYAREARMNSALLPKEEYAKATLMIDTSSESSAMRKFKVEGAVKTINAAGYGMEQDTRAEEETRDVIREYHNIVEATAEEKTVETPSETEEEEIF